MLMRLTGFYRLQKQGMGDPAFCGSSRLGFARQPDKDPRLHRICGNSPGQSPAARPHSRQRSLAWRQTDPSATAGCTQACSCSNGPSGEQVSNDRTPANALEKLLRLQPSQASSNTVLRAVEHHSRCRMQVSGAHKFLGQAKVQT